MLQDQLSKGIAIVWTWPCNRTTVLGLPPSVLQAPPLWPRARALQGVPSGCAGGGPDSGTGLGSVAGYAPRVCYPARNPQIICSRVGCPGRLPGMYTWKKSRRRVGAPGSLPGTQPPPPPPKTQTLSPMVWVRMPAMIGG